jgi:exopolysaccharide production protein ExoZ
VLSAKFASIQVLRAIAANLVVLFHLISLQERFYPDLSTLTIATSFLGPAGVHCFFAISGFVVTRVAIASLDWRPFLAARFIRIYPIYWVYLFAMILFYVVWRGEPVTTMAVIKSIALWPEPAPKILPVAWSLVYEM